MLYPYLGYYTLRSAHCRQIANYCSARATATAVQRLRLSESAGRQLLYRSDGYTEDSTGTCSYRAVTGISGEYISALLSISFVGEHCTHSSFVKPPAPVNIFFVRSAYLLFSIVRLHPPQQTPRSKLTACSDSIVTHHALRIQTAAATH